MPLFADEAFWKVPNIHEVVGAAGLLLAFVSIWFSWWLAKRDIRKRIDEAAQKASTEARDELRRIARGLATDSLADACRVLELARESGRNKIWSRAADLCQQCGDQLAENLGRSLHEPGTRAELLRVSTDVRLLVSALRAQPRARAGELQDDHADQLDETIRRLRRIVGQLRTIDPEVTDARTDGR